MTGLMKVLVGGGKVTDEMIADELHEICDRVHSSCGDECPVYEKNGSIPWIIACRKTGRTECSCFKDGAAMLAFLRGK